MKRLLYSVIFVCIFIASCEENYEEAPVYETVQMSLAKMDSQMEGAKKTFKTICSSCHGEKMQAFADRRWKHGNEPDSLKKSIINGFPEAGMPPFGITMSDTMIDEMVNYIIMGIENVDKYKSSDTILSNIFTHPDYTLRADTIVSGLKIPWGMAFLPNGNMLITERNGELLRFDGEKTHKIGGVPTVVARGQGGLLDVNLHPDYENNGWIYIAYSKPGPEINGRTSAATSISRGKIINDSLVDVEEIFQATPFYSTSHHFGTRLEFDKDGYLYFAVGDRGKRDINPQSLSNHCGKIHRINDDGSIPADNPFVNIDTAMASIYSYGHRNPQGVSMEPNTGRIWTSEHGPRGGDEVNLIEKGKNYGWPVISYGLNYDGTIFTSITKKEGMEQPNLYWVPSIAPCGSDFVRGDIYPKWKGDLLVGSLRFGYINRCKIENNEIVHEEHLVKGIGRVRNVEVGPDGYIYVARENPGIIFKLVPITPEN